MGGERGSAGDRAVHRDLANGDGRAPVGRHDRRGVVRPSELVHDLEPPGTHQPPGGVFYGAKQHDLLAEQWRDLERDRVDFGRTERREEHARRAFEQRVRDRDIDVARLLVDQAPHRGAQELARVIARGARAKRQRSVELGERVVVEDEAGARELDPQRLRAVEAFELPALDRAGGREREHAVALEQRGAHVPRDRAAEGEPALLEHDDAGIARELEARDGGDLRGVGRERAELVVEGFVVGRRSDHGGREHDARAQY